MTQQNPMKSETCPPQVFKAQCLLQRQALVMLIGLLIIFMHPILCVVPRPCYAGYAAAELQACMSRLLRLHQYAGAAEGCESLAPLVFIKEKYAQECWLKASLQAVPQMTSTSNADTTRAVEHNAVPGGMPADPDSINVPGCPVQGANSQDVPGCTNHTQPMDL